MTKENNKVDINKHEVDIDTLKKQNVNDLLSLKELYSKLEELGEKITQIKYIDNTLIKKLKKEYENLKKIILDENIQVQLDNKIDEFNLNLTHNIETIKSQLTNDIETINSQLETNTKLTTEKNIYYSRIGGNIQTIIDNMKVGQTLIIDTPVTIDYTININKNIDFICDEPITVNDKDAIKIGIESKVEKRKFIINIVNNNNKWLTETIGLELGKVYNSKIEVNYIYGFNTGIKTTPNGGGCVYNDFYINYINDCKLSINLSNINGGWTNENYFYGGFRLITSSLTSQSKNRIGILITSDDEKYKNNNSNVFNKPAFELGATKINESYCVKIEHGTNNKFINCRYENEQQFAKIENQATDNEFSFNYCKYNPFIEEPKGLHQNNLNNKNTSIQFRNIFNFNFDYNICEYNDTKHSIKNASFYAVGSTYFNEVSNNVITKNSNGYYILNSTNKVGVKIDTSIVKKFKIKSNCEPGYGGRLFIKTFDSEGNPINENNNQVSIWGSFTTTGNGIFQTSTDSTDGVYKTFYVSDDVKSIIVALSSGAKELRIKGFSIFAETDLDTNIIIPGLYSEYFIVNNRVPTTGLFRENEKIYNSNTTEGKVISWIYKEGNWKPMGTY